MVYYHDFSLTQISQKSSCCIFSKLKDSLLFWQEYSIIPHKLAKWVTTIVKWQTATPSKKVTFSTNTQWFSLKKEWIYIINIKISTLLLPFLLNHWWFVLPTTRWVTKNEHKPKIKPSVHSTTCGNEDVKAKDYFKDSRNRYAITCGIWWASVKGQLSGRCPSPHHWHCIVLTTNLIWCWRKKKKTMQQCK